MRPPKPMRQPCCTSSQGAPVMLRRRAVRSLVQHAARVQSGRWVIATPWSSAECTRSHPSFVWRSPRLLSANAQTWRALRAALCGSRRYVTAAYVVAYYPPAPLVVATSASGARLTDMPESAMVRSLVGPWLGFGVALAERRDTARCIAADMLSSRAWRKLHFCCMSVARSMLHAAFMMRLARKANGSPWCAEGTNRTEFPCGFSSTAAVCRTCRTLTHGRAAPATDRAAAPPGILTPPLPTAAPGPHSAPGTGTPVPIPTFRPGPSPQLAP